jgi:hypothetical protein
MDKGSVVARQVRTAQYRIHQVLIDSHDSSNNSNGDFVIKLATPLRNVFAVRLLKSELIYSFPQMNDGIYLYLNGYKLLIRSEQKDTIDLFARINIGVNNFQCVTTNILDDPYTYILNPIQLKLDRFDVKVLDTNNKLRAENTFNLVLHLAIFCYI